MEDLISVIVPVYNVKEYLPECIESIIFSDYKQIEVILVDDGSTDGSDRICDLYALKDTRIKAFHQQNSGVSVARNAGLSLSNGDYLFFCDADDYIDKKMLSSLHQSICKNKSDMAICGYRVVRDGKFINHSLKQEVVPATVAIEKCLTREYDLTLWNKLFRKNSIDAQNLFRKDLKIGEDALWLIKTLLGCESVSVCDIIGYNYRQNREGSAVYNSRKSRIIESCKSRYESNYEIYTMLITSNRNAAQMALKTAVFSIRDLLKEAYLTDQTDLITQYMPLYKRLLNNYFQYISKGQVFFTIKSVILYLGIKFNIPKKAIKSL